MSTVLVDFDLSIKVSVPTSRRPISSGLMPYFSRSEEVTVRAMEFTSSLSPVMLMAVWPRPMVYFPGIGGVGRDGGRGESERSIRVYSLCSLSISLPLWYPFLHLTLRDTIVLLKVCLSDER